MEQIPTFQTSAVACGIAEEIAGEYTRLGQKQFHDLDLKWPMPPEFMQSDWRKDFVKAIATNLALGRMFIRKVSKQKQRAHEAEFTTLITTKMFEEQDKWFKHSLAETAKFADQLSKTREILLAHKTNNAVEKCKVYHLKMFEEQQTEHAKDLDKAYQEAESWKQSHKTLKRQFDLQLAINKDLKKQLDRACASALSRAGN